MSCYPAAGIAVRVASAVFCIAGLLLCNGCKSALAGGGRDAGGLVHAAATPLRDVGLLRPDVPDALKDLGYPYSLTALTALTGPTAPAGDCTLVGDAIATMDALLGDESYQPSADQDLGSRATAEAGDYAASTMADAAADVLPYRSWVRRLSGANRAERRAAAAHAMGEQRRTFLRGYAAGLGCAIALPAPPPVEHGK